VSVVPWIALVVSLVSAVFTGLTYLARRREEERALRADLILVDFQVHRTKEFQDQLIVELVNSGAHRAVNVAVTFEADDGPFRGRRASTGPTEIESGKRLSFVFFLPEGTILSGPRDAGYRAVRLDSSFTARFRDGSGERVQEIRLHAQPASRARRSSRVRQKVTSPFRARR
jgi:hypothetical protein